MNHFDAIRAKLDQYGIDGMMLTEEYNRFYACGFASTGTDGICLVTAGVDVHRLKKDDTDDCGRGYRAKPFHIPYRALLPKGVSNLLLAGRCLSGDFYPHAAYRMMGNMAATGEAAGFAAAECIKKAITPKALDGKTVSSFMQSRGYAL